MLDSETKRKIDNLRNILVGRLPSPESQVKQITTGLIYKFMNDLDEKSVEMGGKRSFFVGEYKKYAWKNLFDPKMEGADKVNLYRDAIENMYNNSGAPELFREIFKDADLPFRDASTLNMFLKGINEFEYSHSEKMGDAFEYLLSKMDSQGDAGQFRTPRHIIDFIVEIVNPQKNEKILDPACGTAGFLISSFKHIQKHNTAKKSNGRLTAADRKRIGKNLVGYDISPDMIRISLVNMYLHQFPTPQIHEYDTLSSEDRWNEYYDVILANPPFFSPTGGIQPHSRFGVQSKRAEVLFVDYIKEHLKPKGRAGIIVPEGIIFQTGKAYKTLRKKLVEDCLVGVISLPAGVFNPYSGVKTSILILDKELHKKTDSIFFAKVENDGFSLGAQRTPIGKNDLSIILEQIKQFENDNISKNLKIISKEKILKDDFSLNISRYSATNIKLKSNFPLVTIGSVSHIERGGSPRPIKNFITNKKDGINWIKIGDAVDGSKYITQTREKIKPEGVNSSRRVDVGDFILSNSMSFGRPYILQIAGCIHDGWLRLKYNRDMINEDFFYYILSSQPVYEQFTRLAAGGVVNNLNKELVSSAKFPLPPIEIQREIVKELDAHQKVIDGCRQVVENYKPTIDIDPSWKKEHLSKIMKVDWGNTSLTKNSSYHKNGKYLGVSAAGVDGRVKHFEYESDGVVVSAIGANCGKVFYLSEKFTAIKNTIVLHSPSSSINLKFYFYYFDSKIRFSRRGTGQPFLSKGDTEELLVPVPPKHVQDDITERMDEVVAVIKGNKKLIEIYSQKIQDRISKVWGE